MREVYIFGHKKPDTDSVTSAISLSYLKNKMGVVSKPMILGYINKETEFVLNYFNFKIPEYLDDVKLQIKDLNYYKNCFVPDTFSLDKTYKYMQENNITGVPIVDKNRKFKGLLTSKMIASELINGNFTKLNTSYKNIIDVLNGESILQFDEEIRGNIIVAAYRSTTFLNVSNLNKDTIMIVGDRHSLIEEAVNDKIKLLIIVGNLEIKEEHIRIAFLNGVNIIRTSYDTFHTAKLIGLSNYVKNLLSSTRNVTFNENMYYTDFKDKSIKYGYNNYPIVNNRGACLGLMRITDTNKLNKKQVILVDHNEVSQSVEGLEEAEILEIIDHHKIGALTTNMPINFRNMTVGSTNTIIYSMYIENNIDIPSNIAGIMLSGIISDTLEFTSPTTTEYDKFVATNLSKIVGLNIDEFANQMFKAGTNLEGKTIDEIIDGDIKIFDVDGKKIAVSQVITLNSDEILNKKAKYIYEINKMKKDREYEMLIFCVTDIRKDGSYILFDHFSESILADAFNYQNIYEGFFVEKCLSRKKQLVPIIMEAIR